MTVQPPFSKAADAGASRDQRFAALGSLWPWLRPHRRQLGLALLAIMLVAGALLSLGRGIAFLVDSGLSRGDAVLLDRAVLACIGITLLLALGSYLRTVLINRVAERVMADIRKAVFGHSLGLHTAWYEKTRSGDVISTITVDTTLIQTVMASSLSMALRNLLVLTGGTVLLVLASPKLALIVAGVIPLVVVPVVLIGRRLRQVSRLAQDRLADISVAAEEALTAISTIKAFGREALMRQYFDKAAETAFQMAVRRLQLRGLISGITIFLVFTAIAVILWIGGHDLLKGEMSAGDLSAFVFYAALVASAVGALSDIAGEIQRAAGAAERIADLLAEQPAIIAPQNPVRLPASGLDIQLDSVHFAYPSRADLPCLENVSLRIAAGERVALVGPSGAGKSTLLALLLRLFDPDQGCIRIGGVALPACSPADLRSRIGLVAQETALFTGSIGENIRFGRPDADQAELVEAARKANADSFIQALPDGYETAIGEKGVQLSGGQRQRLAIARAVLRDPSILLLDEATSALDAESEYAVQTALEDLMTGRTTLVIAHRLATVLSCERILVLDQGRLVASGSHEELLSTSPLYHRLASLQFAAGEDGQAV